MSARSGAGVGSPLSTRNTCRPITRPNTSTTKSRSTNKVTFSERFIIAPNGKLYGNAATVGGVPFLQGKRCLSAASCFSRKKRHPSCWRVCTKSEKHVMIHKEYHKQRHQVSDGIFEGVESYPAIVAFQQLYGVLKEAQAENQGARQINPAGHPCDKR